MSAETELLWPGVALMLLLLLGTVAGLCVRCSRPGVKKVEKIYEQKNQGDDQQNFVLVQTYSLARQVWPGPLMDTASDVSPPRKDKILFSHYKDSGSPRYQNFIKGSQHEPDTSYIDPIPTNYYNWECFQKPLEDDDDDTNSYENVLICKPLSAASSDDEDYHNSEAIHKWRESRRAVGPTPRAARQSPAGSPEEDCGEPDYVNEDVATARRA
uniref:linker for activation of T-cells family member 2 n=1 Tax=Jaculus jaculus TaxID=51337 RepID=UPI001E1B1FE6|nr:linker for activation of T-cells family member 2 [Jaculus jaculus]